MCLNFTLFSTLGIVSAHLPQIAFFLHFRLSLLWFSVLSPLCMKHPHIHAHPTNKMICRSVHHRTINLLYKRRPSQTATSFMLLKGQNEAQLVVFLRRRATCEWDSHLVRYRSIMGTKINSLSTSDCIISQSPASQVLTRHWIILIWLFCSSATLMKTRSKSCLQHFKTLASQKTTPKKKNKLISCHVIWHSKDVPCKITLWYLLCCCSSVVLSLVYDITLFV